MTIKKSIILKYQLSINVSSHREWQESERVLDDESDESLAVEDEFVPLGVLVADEGVEALHLGRGGEQVEGAGTRLAEICIGEFFAKFEPSLEKEVVTGMNYCDRQNILHLIIIFGRQ